MSTARVGVVVALEREIAPLVRGWSRISGARGSFALFRHGQAVVMVAGLGGERARQAAVTLVESHPPALLVSAGYAGALDPGLGAGDLVVPLAVVDAATYARFGAVTGQGVLVTSDTVAQPVQKAVLRERYGASIVDMEAAAVAEVARERGIPFLAVKAVSDTAKAELPQVASFVDSHGQVQTLTLLAFCAVRPWLWPGLLRLWRDSRRATATLCQVLQVIIREPEEDRLPLALQRVRGCE